MDGPAQVFTAIALISLLTVMFGGFSLLRSVGAVLLASALLTTGAAVIAS